MIGLSLSNGNAKYSNIKQTIQLFNLATEANKDQNSFYLKQFGFKLSMKLWIVTKTQILDKNSWFMSCLLCTETQELMIFILACW